jgi:hypothetical protein
LSGMSYHSASCWRLLSVQLLTVDSCSMKRRLSCEVSGSPESFQASIKIALL